MEGRVKINGGGGVVGNFKISINVSNECKKDINV